MTGALGPVSPRKELEARLVPGGPEFQEAVSRAVAPVERGHAQQLADLREKVDAAQARYAELEDEFRAALTIEASRFSEVSRPLGGASYHQCH